MTWFSFMAAILVGVVTWYPADMYGGNPLYCDRGNGMLYSTDIPAWVAVSNRLFEMGGWQCGDWVRLTFEDGESMWVQALDAGPLHRYTADGVQIVADLPEHQWPYHYGRLSAPVTVFNESLANRQRARVMFGHLVER